MKVIKAGSLRTTLMIGKCRTCGCEVEAQRTETQPTMKWDERSIQCPTIGCGELIRMTQKPMTEEEISAALRRHLNSRKAAR